MLGTKLVVVKVRDSFFKQASVGVRLDFNQGELLVDKGKLLIHIFLPSVEVHKAVDVPANKESYKHRKDTDKQARIVNIQVAVADNGNNESRSTQQNRQDAQCVFEQFRHNRKH